jgi:hypothetical protein
MNKRQYACETPVHKYFSTINFSDKKIKTKKLRVQLEMEIIMPENSRGHR